MHISRGVDAPFWRLLSQMLYDISPGVDMDMYQHLEGIYESLVEKGRCVCRFLIFHLAFSRSTDSTGGWDKCSLIASGLFLVSHL